MKKASREKSSRLNRWLMPVLPPLVTGVLGVVSTLLATGLLFPLPNHGTTAAAGTTTATPAVLNAPYVYFSSKRIDNSLTDCMAKANAELERLGFTGREAKRYFAWGYQNETTGLVWCNTDEKLVIYVAASRNDQEAAQKAEALRRSF